MPMGIHTGEAPVGSMGSTPHIELAVIGDAVNCTLRLECYDHKNHETVLPVLLSSTTLGLQTIGFRKPLNLEY